MTPNTEVLHRCKTTGIEAIITRHRLRWAGHVMLMDDDRLPKQVLLSRLDGKRRIGRPQLRFKDTLNYAMQNCNI